MTVGPAAIRGLRLLRPFRPLFSRIIMPALLIHGLSAQGCLSLSTAAVPPGGIASLELSFNSTAEGPASVQWAFEYPNPGISDVTVGEGPAAVAAGKSLTCNANGTMYTCVVVGQDARPIGNGIVAKITATLAPGAMAATIVIHNPIGAAADGTFMPVSSASGFVTSASVSPDRRLHPPLKRLPGNRCRAAR